MRRSVSAIPKDCCTLLYLKTHLTGISTPSCASRLLHVLSEYTASTLTENFIAQHKRICGDVKPRHAEGKSGYVI